jgi:hypothetical protein
VLEGNPSVTEYKRFSDSVTQGFSPEKISPEGLSYKLWLTEQTITEGLRWKNEGEGWINNPRSGQ